MFDVIFWNESDHDNYVITAKNLPHLFAAKDARRLSGDLVVRAGTQEVVGNTAWLWGWELADPTCYAHRQVLAAMRRS